MSTRRIVSIQYMRGLAALGVVFCHFGTSTFSVLQNGQYGVLIFFLLSGFVIVYSLTGANYKLSEFFKFMLKRSIRIEPAYIVTLLLNLILFKVLSYFPEFGGNKRPFSVWQFIAHVFYLVPFFKVHFYFYSLWTLCIEFQFYLLVGLGYFLVDNRIYQVAFLLFFALSCFIPFSNAYYLVFNYAPIFALGISLVGYFKQRNWQNLAIPFFCLILIAVKFGIPIFIIILLSCATILYFKNIIQPLGFLGNISYSLYLTHGLVAIVLLGLIKKLNIAVNHNQLFWLLAEVVVAILTAYIFYLLVERPSITISKRIFYKKNKYLV